MDLSLIRFMHLLYATHNISPGTEPGSEDSEKTVSSALRTAYSLADEASKSSCNAAGAELAARLFVEVMSSEDPNAYMEQEIHRGLTLERHEFDNASIVVSTSKRES